MRYVMYIGIVLFVVGMVSNHIVFAITRKLVRAGEGISSRHRAMTWAAVAMTVVGLGLAAAGFFLDEE